MKKNRIRTCGVLILVLLLTGCPITAQENISLGLSRMLTLAISNNLEFKKANVQLENTKLKVRKMEADNLLTESTITDLQKEVALLNQQNQFQLEKDQLLIQMADDYFQLLMAEKDIESKKKNVELERIVLENVKNQVAAGYSIDLDLLQQGNEYYDALFSYQESELDYKQQLIKMKDNLGIEHNQDIQVTSMQIPEFPAVDLADALNKARENSITMQIQSIEINQAKRELEKAKTSDLSEIEMLKLENNLAIVQLEKSLSQQDLDYQVETQWLNYNKAKNDILLSQKSLEQMRENDSMIRQQVKAGLRTDEEALSATIGVLDAESRLISSVRQVYQAYLELQRLMGTLNEGVLQ